MRVPWWAVLLLLIPCAPAGAEEESGPRHIDLPRAGVSLELESGWLLDAYAGPVFLVTKGEVRLSVERVDPPPTSFAAGLETERRALADGTGGAEPELRLFPLFGADHGRTWTVKRDDVVHSVGLYRTADGRFYRTRLTCPEVKSESLRAVGRILRSLDLTAYVHTERHVDWTSGGWTLDLPASWGATRGADGVVALHAASDPTSGLRVRMQDGTPRIERFGAPADPATVDRIAATFRLGPDPGDRAELPRDRFPRADCPPLRFTLPDGWSLERPESAMRLVEFVVPGDPPLRGVTFFFGPGRGGSVGENLRNWKSQIEVEDELPEERVFQSEGVKITTLDLQGIPRQDARRNEIVGEERTHRMLAAVVEVEGGPLFLKLQAPAGSMREVVKPFFAWVESFRASKSDEAD